MNAICGSAKVRSGATAAVSCTTLRSTRQPTARRLARGAARHIICSAGQAAHRRLRVNSNVDATKAFRITMRVGYPSWSIEAPDSWRVTEHPECLTLELSDEAALQLSSAQKKSGEVTEQDLFFSKDNRGGWGKHRNTELGEFIGIVYEYQEDETTWIRWFLRNASTLLFVTYNGTKQAANNERAEVNQILSTLRVEALRGV